MSQYKIYNGTKVYTFPNRSFTVAGLDDLTGLVDTNQLATKANSNTLSQLQSRFNLKQNLVVLTTTGTGAATFNQSTGSLNIPTPSVTGTNTGDQTLALGASSGSFTISGTGGNTIVLSSLNKTTDGIFSNANVPPALSGLYPYSISSGATNYPFATGGGFKSFRGNNTFAGYFEFIKQNNSNDDLYFRTGIDATTTNTWDIVAGRTWTNTQLSLKASLASPAFTGNPTATTQAAADNSTRLATTAYVTSAVVALSSVYLPYTGGLFDLDLTGRNITANQSSGIGGMATFNYGTYNSAIRLLNGTSDYSNTGYTTFYSKNNRFTILTPSSFFGLGIGTSSLTAHRTLDAPNTDGVIQVMPIVNTTITTTQTSSSLNTLYPNAVVGQQVTAPNVGTGMKFEKINTTSGGTWVAWAVSTI